MAELSLEDALSSRPTSPASQNSTCGPAYAGRAGHTPDTTWTGKPDPPGYLDLSGRVNTSLGGQAGHYPVGYKPTEFVLDEGDPPE